jgi:hydrogenase-1 operon protein HyaE
MTTSTDHAANEKLHPLFAQLFDKHGYANVDAASIDAFAAHAGHALLVFMEDPLRVRETLDLAVIVPELAHALPGRFRVGVLLPATARQLCARYGVRRWPAIVMLRDGAYVGSVEGLRNWEDYVQEIVRLLEAPPGRPPTIGVAVKAAGTAAGGCAT